MRAPLVGGGRLINSPGVNAVSIVRPHPFHGDGLSLSQLRGGAVSGGDKTLSFDSGSVVHTHDLVGGQKWNQGAGFIHDYLAVA